METLTIGQYATAHKLEVDGFVSLISEVREDGTVTADTAVPVSELDEAAALADDVAADDLRDAMEGVKYAKAELRSAEADLRRSIKEALSEGIAATRIAEVLGVSRARVYQLRDGKR